MAGREGSPAYHSLGFDAPRYRTDDVILRQIESTRSLGLNAHLRASARLHFVLLRGGRPSRERKKNYRAPQRLSIKLQSVHKVRHDAFSDRQRNFPNGLSVERRLYTCYFLYLPGPGGGMADAEDLKSSGVLPHGGSSPPPGTSILFSRRRVTISRSTLYKRYKRRFSSINPAFLHLFAGRPSMSIESKVWLK
jgi:hypothetical protein